MHERSPLNTSQKQPRNTPKTRLFGYTRNRPRKEFASLSLTTQSSCFSLSAMFQVGALEVGGRELSQLDVAVMGAGVEVLEGLLVVLVLVLVLVIGGFAGS